MEPMREIFARFDMDGDGSLTQLELAALLRSLGLKPSGDEVRALLTGMDANGNGTVEFDELAAAIAPLVAEESALVDQELLLEVFRRFDRDGNGLISAPELARAMAKTGNPISFLELTEMIRQADTDGDGAISFSEFAAIMAKSAVEFLGLSGA
ncbi:unnamed protein product [Spirodela intermedia]|uniref:EF-hand domain-containing protein n=1 Tax=Spirodela intermedia TaxID=51605 RepID=A0A7I8IT94_SPIIN|nr:unnamed protein product [Spirodela intermedia]CAA6661232.1 unnamed protein product [Spirodela intermedia]